MAITKTLDVPDHVRTIILDQMEWIEVEDKIVGRIKLQLQRQIYVDVNKVLVRLGGKWNRAKKFMGHVFDEDPRPALGELEEKDKLTLEVFGFYRTPRPVVEEMLDLTSPMAHEWVLEPSAGDGAILDVLVERTGDLHRVHAVELHEGRRAQLLEKGFRVVGEDFMEFDGKVSYDVILMNPPFENGQDKRHILHAYYDCLAPDGRMAAITSAGGICRSDNQKLHNLVDRHGQSWKLPPDTFEGTMINSVLIYLQKPAETH